MDLPEKPLDEAEPRFTTVEEKLDYLCRLARGEFSAKLSPEEREAERKRVEEMNKEIFGEETLPPNSGQS